MERIPRPHQALALRVRGPPARFLSRGQIKRPYLITSSPEQNQTQNISEVHRRPCQLQPIDHYQSRRTPEPSRTHQDRV